MTHLQRFWTARDVHGRTPELGPEDVAALRDWCTQHPKKAPLQLSHEQLLLFLHCSYSDLAAAQSCIEAYYKLRLNVPQFFENRDIERPDLKKALQVLYYGIIGPTTPLGYKIIYHALNDNDASKYSFNDGFKLLAMAMDAVYARGGPIAGIILLFDLRGVKFSHVTRLPLTSVKRCLEYIQEANPVRLKGIHVLNVHPVIDKIMLLIRPFLKKQFLQLLHFYKEGDESIYEAIPKSCMPSNYNGEQDDIEKLHEHFIGEMQDLRHLFVEEDALMRTAMKKQKGKIADVPIDLNRLEID